MNETLGITLGEEVGGHDADGTVNYYVPWITYAKIEVKEDVVLPSEYVYYYLANTCKHEFNRYAICEKCGMAKGVVDKYKGNKEIYKRLVTVGKYADKHCKHNKTIKLWLSGQHIEICRDCGIPFGWRNLMLLNEVIK